MLSRLSWWPGLQSLLYFSFAKICTLGKRIKRSLTAQKQSHASEIFQELQSYLQLQEMAMFCCLCGDFKEGRRKEKSAIPHAHWGESKHCTNRSLIFLKYKNSLKANYQLNYKIHLKYFLKQKLKISTFDLFKRQVLHANTWCCGVLVFSGFVVVIVVFCLF